METSQIPTTSFCLKFFHWSSNGLATPNFAKISHNFDMASFALAILDSKILHKGRSDSTGD